MSREAAVSDLSREIVAFIERGRPDEALFNQLALAVFAYQHEWNAPYRRFCDGRDAGPGSVTHWSEIPPAPAAAFKRFALTSAPEADCEPKRGGRIFHSSGTTGSETSRHFLDATALGVYRASLKAGYRRFVPNPPVETLAFMPPVAEAPNSSLSFMLDALGATFHWEESPGDTDWITRVGHELQNRSEQVTLFGTAFAWVHFFDAIPDRFSLPGGSVAIETGGFKGRSREVSRDELYELFQERLGIPASHCLSEYGMSEMTSQFYDSSLVDHLAGRSRPARKVAPFWLKTRIFDPVTAKEALPGVPGLLAHYDLANLNSVLAIQTEDLGQATEDAEGFVLLGRAPGAILRGCSLTAEDRMG
ncbi:MAG: hypothetical protein H7Z41_19115 [Cytophagales bacterium]|nr:hypothetical protein [Armatimonadota bacterium]